MTADWSLNHLQARGLSVARGGLLLLEGLDLSVRPGEGLVLRGPNGIGKTTLLRTLAGLQPPQAGSIHAPADSLTYAGHADGIKSALSLRENLAFWAEVHGQPAQVDTALAQMGLGALASRRAAELSAGQKRRLGLARVLVCGRWLWLMDEPTVSLDAASTALFAQAVSRHLGAGGAAVIASHLDLGLPGAEALDLASHRAAPAAPRPGGFEGAFA
ncbi:MAG: heme ABC exporter ATP-binding protein CcmA [Paracoccaceae bacterium]